MDCVRVCLAGTSNLHLANRAFCDLLFCFVRRLNSASHILANKSVQERRFLLKIICFPRNFLSESQLFRIPSDLLSPPFVPGLGNAAKSSVSPGVIGAIQ